LPHNEIESEVTGAETCASNFTTGLDPILGVHIAISPFVCPLAITAFYVLTFKQVASPLFVLHSAISLPTLISRYFMKPNLVAVANKK